MATLLDPITGRGLTVGGVALDSGFDSGDTLLMSQGRRLSDALPLRRKGNGRNRRHAAFARPSGTVTTVDWTTDTGGR